jgi:hypothetical protein
MALGTLWLGIVAWAMLNGTGFYAEAEQQMAVEVEAESHAVCQQLGIPFGGIRYSACASALNAVRQQHEWRLARRSAGVL